MGGPQDPGADRHTCIFIVQECVALLRQRQSALDTMYDIIVYAYLSWYVRMQLILCQHYPIQPEAMMFGVEIEVVTAFKALKCSIHQSVTYTACWCPGTSDE